MKLLSKHRWLVQGKLSDTIHPYFCKFIYLLPNFSQFVYTFSTLLIQLRLSTINVKAITNKNYTTSSPPRRKISTTVQDGSAGIGALESHFGYRQWSINSCL
jgi:hypothetical protein